MPRKKKTDEEKELDKLKKRAERLAAEQERLSQKIEVFRVSDDKYLYTTTEGSILSPKQLKRARAERALNESNFDKISFSERRDDEDAGKGYKWKIAGIRERDPEFVKYQSQERYKCEYDYCNFKSIYPEVVLDHMTYTKIPNHPSSIYHGKLSEHELALWKEAFSKSPYRKPFYVKPRT